MHKAGHSTAIEQWLTEVRLHFSHTAPELLSLFDTYAAEAYFGRCYIDSDLRRLPLGAKVLELGAGSLLLSCYLQKEGFDVTALEPVGEGFSHFSKMRQIVLDKARVNGCCPTILDLPAEHLALSNRFDYAFSINVMEHVDNAALVLACVGKSLVVGALYRFTCPNYSFPYEPHFNIPTFFSKKLTEKFLGSKIFGNKKLPDPFGTWASINWINVNQVRSYIRRLPGFRVAFEQSLLVSTLERIVTDSSFAARRSPAIRSLIAGLVFLRIHHLLGLVPAQLQPIIDCKMQKIVDMGSGQ